MLNELTRHFDFSVDFFGNINPLIFSKNNKIKFDFKFHGFIPYNDLVKKYQESNYLINIFNADQRHGFPSKLYDLISIGKPIINIYNSYVIYETYKPRFNHQAMFDFYNINQIDNLILFLSKNRNLRLPYNEIFRNYYHNTPEYFLNQIMNLISK
jgi:hypothetical protein